MVEERFWQSEVMKIVNLPRSFRACSSFHSHLDHKLSKEEVDELEKKKWTYKWVVAMSNYKWRGTGKCFLKVAVLFAYGYVILL